MVVRSIGLDEFIVPLWARNFRLPGLGCSLFFGGSGQIQFKQAGCPGFRELQQLGRAVDKQKQRSLQHPIRVAGENSPNTIFGPGSAEPRSRRSDEAEGVVAQGNPPRYLGGYEPEVHGQGAPLSLASCPHLCCIIGG